MRSNISVLLFVVFLFGGFGLGCPPPKSGTPSGSSEEGILVHLSSGPESAHRVVMALQMATKMAERRSVLVYFDVAGIDVVLEGTSEVSYEGFKGSKEQIAVLLEKKVPLYACPGCLLAKGKTEADLIDGVRVASPDVFFDFARGRIVTLDY